MTSVSVVIPVYNGERYIAKAIDSALAQTYPPAEVIVIDDGSTDSTPDILRKYGDRIRTKRVKNGGCGAARNAGIRETMGEYVAFLDADDVWFRHKLEKQVRIAERYPDTDLISSNYFVRGTDKPAFIIRQYEAHLVIKKFTMDVPISSREAFLWMLKTNLIGVPSAAIVRKQLLNKVGAFDEDPHYRISEDYDYWLRCLTHSSMILMSEPLLYKRTHMTNVSNDKLKMLEIRGNTLLKNMDELQPFIKKEGLEQDVVKTVAEHYYRHGHYCFEIGRRTRAFKLFWKGFLFRKTSDNFFQYLVIVLKKMIRILCFDAVTSKKINRYFKGKP